MTARHCFYLDTQVAALRQIPLDEIPFAMRRGEIPLPTAQTLHGAPLWSVESIDALVANRAAMVLGDEA